VEHVGVADGVGEDDLVAAGEVGALVVAPVAREGSDLLAGLGGAAGLLALLAFLGELEGLAEGAGVGPVGAGLGPAGVVGGDEGDLALGGGVGAVGAGEDDAVEVQELAGPAGGVAEGGGVE